MKIQFRERDVLLLIVLITTAALLVRCCFSESSVQPTAVVAS